MTAVPLGLPTAPARPVAARRPSRRIQAGPVAVGGGAPVSAQSMTTTPTLRVAVMGCVVNGPAEAREAGLGVASGNGKGQIPVQGEVVRSVPESRIVETLTEEAMKIAERMEKDGAAGEPAVTVN